MTTEPAQRGLVAACFDQLLGWHSGLPSEQNSYTKQAVKIPLEGEEHVELVADLYRPVTGDGAPAAGTILVQSPYGRRAPLSVFLARVWAARGHNVLFVSVRGTFGSGGPGLFDPARTDKADGPRVVRWMRKQPWYTGTFATFVSNPVAPRLCSCVTLASLQGMPFRAQRPPALRDGVSLGPFFFFFL